MSRRPVSRRALDSGGRGARPLAAAAPSGRLRRPGAGQGAARDRARGGARPRRGARPRAARRSARARQDEPRLHRPRGARRRASGPVAGPGARAQGRPGGDPHRARGARRALRRRDPPARPAPSRRSSIRRSRTSGSTSSSGRARPRARLTLDLPPFTLVGATTRTGLLTTPLRDRFGMTFRLELLRARRARHASSAAPRGSSASRSRTRRPTRSPAARAGRRASRTASCAACATWPRCGTRARSRPRSPHEALELLEVDGDGLERIDRELLAAIVQKFGGGPVGLSTLAVALGEEPDTIEDVYEPYLLQLGFIQRTPRGRDRHGARARARRWAAARLRTTWTPLLMPELWVPGRGRSRRSRTSSSASTSTSSASRRSAATARRRSRSSCGTARVLQLESRSLPEPGLRLRHALPAREDAPEEMIVPVGAIARIRLGPRRGAPALRLRALAGRRDSAEERPRTADAERQRRNCSSCQEGTGASSSSARPPLGRGRRTRPRRRPRRPRAGLP